MLTELKLHTAIQYCILKQHIENKAKQRWYYNYLPKVVAQGFTLAEILITLTIIGVISSLTIPALINNIDDQQNKIAWRKAFADISSASMRVAADNGGSIKGICNDGDSTCLRDLYLPYLNYTKACIKGQNFGYCWHNSTSFWFLDGTINDFGNDAGAMLSNGNLLSFWNGSKTCSYIGRGFAICGSITIDVNGFKGPNKFGKDLFEMHVTENTVKPYGTQGDIYTNKCEGSTGNRSGAGCAANYLYQ